jgi:hypothetical protein
MLNIVKEVMLHISSAVSRLVKGLLLLLRLLLQTVHSYGTYVLANQQRELRD